MAQGLHVYAIRFRAFSMLPTIRKSPSPRLSTFRVAALVIVVLYAFGAALFCLQRDQQDPFAEGLFLESRHPDRRLAAAQRELEAFDRPDVLRGLLLDLSRDVPSFEAPYLLALFHARQLQEPDTVVRAFEIAIRRYPANGRLRMAYAQWLFQARGYLAAWHAVEQAGVARDPREAAERHLECAMKLEPELVGPALVLFDRERLPVARWLELLPDEPAMREQLMDHLVSVGRDDEARKLLRQLARGDAPANLLRKGAWLALTWKEPVWSLHLAERWQASAPDDLQAVVFVARVHLAMSNPRAAEEHLQEQLENFERKKPGQQRLAGFLCSIGELYLDTRDAARAESFFTRAAATAPSLARAAFGLAQVYEVSGDSAAAAAEYRRVLRSQPDHIPARAGLERLLSQGGVP